MGDAVHPLRLVIQRHQQQVAPTYERLAAAGIAPTSTLLEISRLAFPELLIELEATAVA